MFGAFLREIGDAVLAVAFRLGVERCDFALDDLCESDVRSAHTMIGFHQRCSAILQLLHPGTHEIDQNRRVLNDFRGLFYEVAFHM